MKTEFSDRLHAQKYRGQGEDFREFGNRLASAIAPEGKFREFRDMIMDQRFMPAGRVQAAMGSTKVVTAYNCAVSGTIDDSFVEGQGSIMKRASQAAATMRMGCGIGYDFTPLRPRGDIIRKLGSSSSGPVSFMHIFDAVCLATSSSGHRRGAQMGVMRVDHPDIEEFIRAKQNESDLTGFNISVGITDEFMYAVQNDGEFDLRWDGRVYRTIQARKLWETIMRSTWDWAEPGVLFIDRINEMNNLQYCETIAATNPCGEQPLPPFGTCLLGSFNLTAYLQENDDPEKPFVLNLNRMQEDVALAVEAMDNVIDNTIYPLREQEIEAKSKRRMGLGITGTANAIEALGYPYGSDEFINIMGIILRALRDAAYKASALLAQRKGPFPLYKRDEYLSGAFIEQLPPPVRELIAQHGIRNSHLISIAPTGTISMCADNVSSGIEPVFAYEQERTLTNADGDPQTYHLMDYGYVRDIHGKTADQVTAEEHIAVLAEAYKYVDSAVSKTCNVPPDMPWDDFKQIYMTAWELGCKGCTTYNSGGKRGAILKAKTESPKACYIDPATGRKECE